MPELPYPPYNIFFIKSEHSSFPIHPIFVYLFIFFFPESMKIAYKFYPSLSIPSLQFFIANTWGHIHYSAYDHHS